MIDLRKRELELVAAEYGELDHGPNLDWVIVRGWRLPAGWNNDQTRLMVIIPPGYSVTPPDNFYTDADLRLSDGRQPGSTSQAVQLGESWLQFSYHLESGDWRPQGNLLDGDNLLTFLVGVLGPLGGAGLMAVIRFTEADLIATRSHLLRPGKHFAFFFARTATTANGPIFIVVDIEPVSDDKVEWTDGGAEIDPDALLLVVNRAVRGRLALIEAHNHGGTSPRLSIIDRRGLAEFVPYVLDSLPGLPYGVTVWGDALVYGEFFTPGGTTGTFHSITSIGGQLQQSVSRADDGSTVARELDRQLAWFGEAGQRQLGRLRLGVVGAGGTGSPLIQNLVYLGCRDFLVVDPDIADVTSMNRLVSAAAADIETNKALLARRLVRTVAPGARLMAIAEDLRSRRALDALKSVDVLFGCVDNDGARLVLTELASAYRIPYIDVAVGIEASDQGVVGAGARVFVGLPDGPCLQCAGEIDWPEASYFLAPPQEQEERRQRGYVTGMDVPAPAVVSLNAAASAAAATEFAVLVSGVRPVNLFTEVDLLGAARSRPAQWMTPVAVTRDPSCVICAQADLGAGSVIDRYVLDASDAGVVE